MQILRVKNLITQQQNDTTTNVIYMVITSKGWSSPKAVDNQLFARTHCFLRLHDEISWPSGHHYAHMDVEHLQLLRTSSIVIITEKLFVEGERTRREGEEKEGRQEEETN